MFARGPAVYLIALVALAVSLLTPAMELVPFSAVLAGLVLTAFGLALIARDGLLSLFGLIVAGGAFGIVIVNLV